MTDGSCEIPYNWISLHLTAARSALVRVMAWCLQLGNKPLHEPILTEIFAPYDMTRSQWFDKSWFFLPNEYQISKQFDTLRARQNASHFTDNVFKYIFLYGKCFILIQMLRKWFPMGTTDNNTALIEITARHRASVKPLPEAMVAYFISAYMCQSASMHGHRIA